MPWAAKTDVQRRRELEPAPKRLPPRNTEARRLRGTIRYQKFRRWFRARHPLCEHCERDGRVTATAHVHHVRTLERYPQDLCDESRCVALCASCHARAEARGRAV